MLSAALLLCAGVGAFGPFQPMTHRRAPLATVQMQRQDSTPQVGRRAALGLLSLLPFAATNPAPAAAAEEVQVYFGVGCFWHVQHEFVEAERNILGRSDEALTSLAGYAGGMQTGLNSNYPGRRVVCYHNFQQVADYGKLGHGEVVGMKLPPSAMPAFADEYFKLFKGFDRPDLGDRGPEYRSLIGIPGGMNSPLAEPIKAVADAKGFTLASGKGNDGDTLGKRLIWVYDTASFPFYQAEVYHQYHDGFFPGEDYPAIYNKLKGKFVRDGSLDSTGCPDEI